MTYNDIMQKAGKRIKPNLYYYNNDAKIEISRNDIIKIRPHYSAGLIGTIMRGLEIELKISIPTSTIYFKNMAMFEENSQTKDYGEYYLKEKGTYNADTKTYTYQFYDGFLKLMVPYKAITIDYPCTVNDFIKKLANEMGLKCNVDLTNGSNYLGADIYENIGMTYRDVVADIGKGTFTLFEIVNKELKVCNFKENEIIINDDILKNKNITFNKKNGAFNTIIISRSAESDSLSKSNPENLPDNEKIAYRISDCQLLNRNDRGDYLDGLLNKVYGIEYYVYNVELTGYGGFDPLQKIKFETSNETFNSYVLNNEEIITQGYEENISASEIENVEQNYKVTDTDDRRINNVSLIVDKQQKEINALANKVVDISSTACGVGFVNITNGYKGNLHKLDIYGYMELPIIGNIIIGQFKVNNFKIIVEQNNEVYREYILDDMKNLYQVGTVHDTFEYLDGKCSITKRIGIDDKGNKYVLETPYTIDLKDLIIEVPEGDYKIYTNFNDLHLEVEYLLKNEYTDTFAKQVDLQSEINIRSDEIELLSKKKVNNDEVIASINLTPEKAQIEANKISLKGKEFDLTTDEINIKSTNFNVDKDGNCTANSFTSNDATITGGLIDIVNDTKGKPSIQIRRLDDDGITYRSFINELNFVTNSNYQECFFGAYTTLDGIQQYGFYLYDRNNKKTYIDMWLGNNNPIISLVSDGTGYAVTANSGLVTVSDKNLKENIDYISKENSINIIKNLKPIEFNYINKKRKHRGLIAQEVKKILNENNIYDEIYNYDNTFDSYTLSYEEFIPDLINCIKYQQEQIEKIEKRIEALERNDK